MNLALIPLVVSLLAAPAPASAGQEGPRTPPPPVPPPPARPAAEAPPAQPPPPPARPAAGAPPAQAPHLARPAPLPIGERMTFRDVLARALRKNRDLLRAGLDVDKAAQAARAARGQFDTQVTGSVKYQRSTAEPVSSQTIQTLRSSALSLAAGVSQLLPTGGSVSLGYSTSRSTSLLRIAFSGTPFENASETWDTAITLSVTHPLLKGVGTDRNLAALRKARLARDAAAWAAKARAETVVRDLWKAFLDVVNAQGAVSVQGEALAQAERELTRAMALEAAGRLPPADLVDYRFAVAQQRRALLEARTSWLQLSLSLRLLTGERVLPSHGAIRAVLPVDPFPVPVPDAARAAEAALRHSRDLLAALEQLKIQKITLVASRRDTWPSLDLQAAIGPEGRSDSIGGSHATLFRFKSMAYSVGLTFSYLIGNRAALAARDQAAIDVRRQEVAIDELRQNLVSAASQTVALLRLERQLARTTSQEHALARLRLENERKRFAVGRSSLFVLLQLQNDVTATAQKALSARLACLKRWAELEALTGALLGRFGLTEGSFPALRAGRGASAAGS